MYKVSYRSRVNGQQVKSSVVTRFAKIKLGLGLIWFGR